MENRIANAGLASRLMSASAAAALIQPGMTVGMSGFTGAGYPKAVPLALAERITAAHGRGEDFGLRILTGASTAPELDGALARAGGIDFRLPYQSDPELRARINSGQIEYMDIHLGHVAQYAWFGFLGRIDVAVSSVCDMWRVSVSTRSDSRAAVSTFWRCVSARLSDRRRRKSSLSRTTSRSITMLTSCLRFLSSGGVSSSS